MASGPLQQGKAVPAAKGKQTVQPVSSGLLGGPSIPTPVKEICIMAAGNRRNGIALLGREVLHKQVRKENVFPLLLSLVLAHSSAVVCLYGEF